jgi:hypothetical protein
MQGVVDEGYRQTYTLARRSIGPERSSNAGYPEETSAALGAY